MAGRYDFLLKQGNTHKLHMSIKLDNGVPVEVMGKKAAMQVRLGDHRGKVAIELTTENGGIMLGPSGTISITISAASTEDLCAEKAVYDLELIDGEEVERIMEGQITLSPNVTRMRK